MTSYFEFPVSLRLVLVTRRYWPLVDETENLLASMAAEFARQGVQVTVLTARKQADWPERVVCQGVPIVRLWHPPPEVCGEFRYRRALTRWLRMHASEFDLAYVCGLRRDAGAALAAARSAGFPVVLRAERAGLSGDLHWQLEARGGARLKRACYQADALVAPCRAVEREFIAAGYPRGRIHRLTNGVPMVPTRTADDRLAARVALAEEHVWLEMLPQAPLAVAAGPLEESHGFNHLVAGWPGIVARWPNARLWIVGQGSCRGKLLTQIEALGMSSWITLPGAFDELEDVLAAADLFVLPALEEGMSPALLQAMAMGLPIVATDIPAHRELIVANEHGLLVPAEDSDALTAAMECLLDDPALATQLGWAARTRVEREFSFDRMVEEHLSLFESLRAGLPPSHAAALAAVPRA